MGLGEDIQKHIEEHEILGIKRFTLGNAVDYFVFDPTNHTLKLYLNSLLVQEWP